LAVAAVVSSGESATAVANATLLPLAFFSGVFFPPSDDAPAWLDAVGNFFPLKHFVEPFTAAFNPQLTGTQFDWVSIGVMVLWGLFGIVIASRYFKWESAPGSGGRKKDRTAAAGA
ncbi:MAG: ABC transporter permease, partial [Acidimicrobiia bacterium]|nr:ABC transporter permease [Acidimicrobiia bacterium]